MDVTPPRALTPLERAVLERLLSPAYPGVDVLRTQVQGALVVRLCDCGCPSFDLQVAADAQPAAELPLGPAPFEGDVQAADPSQQPGSILLFLERGRLSSVEYVWIDHSPGDWPSPERIRLVPAARSSG